MIVKRRNSRKALGALAILSILVAGGFAYTAANVVPATKAGDGSGAITGYTVSNVDYTLQAGDPGMIDAVDFDVDTAPTAGSDMWVQLVTGGTWYTCTNVATALTCDTSGGGGEPVTPTDNLRVVIAD